MVGSRDREPWVEYLSEDECWNLLNLHEIGRVGVVVDGAPEVYPVNFTVFGRSVVFRTDPGNKLRALAARPAVCFQVDGFDFTNETGWSVLIKGHGAEVPDDQTEDLWHTALHVWSLGDKAHWVSITPREVTGRRISRR